MKRSSEGGSIYGTGILSHYYYCNKFFTRAVETAHRYKLHAVHSSLCTVHYYNHRISTLETSVEELAEQSGALQILVARGIAMACFILARCLQLGQAVSKNGDLAQTYFQRVSMHCNSNTNSHQNYFIDRQPNLTRWPWLIYTHKWCMAKYDQQVKFYLRYQDHTLAALEDFLYNTV